MEEQIKAIMKMDSLQIDYILDAVLKRKRELYPDWNIIYYAHKKGEGDEMETIRPFLNSNK